MNEEQILTELLTDLYSIKVIIQVNIGLFKGNKQLQEILEEIKTMVE